MASAATAVEPKPAAKTPDEAGPKPIQWLAERRNQYIAAAGAVAVVALIGWLVVVSGKRKEQFAGRALDQARSAAEAGNLPLAASEFQKVITTFSGTRASEEAVINLNQVRLINGQYELAAVNLQEFLKTNPRQQFLAPAYGLLGRALETAKRPAEAADAYLNASRSAEAKYLKAELLMDAARVYEAAGDSAKAIETYRGILKDYGSTSAKTEAEVRLAELTAGQM